jgi:hypothetical protein
MAALPAAATGKILKGRLKALAQEKPVIIDDESAPGD